MGYTFNSFSDRYVHSLTMRKVLLRCGYKLECERANETEKDLLHFGKGVAQNLKVNLPLAALQGVV